MKKETRLKCLGLSLGLSLCASSSVVAGTSLSLEEALTKAEASNPGLQALQAQHAAAQARVHSADALPDPRLQVSVFGESVQTRTGPQERAYSLSQTIPWLEKLSVRERAALSAAEVYGAAYQTKRLKLAEQVRVAYYEVAYLEKAIGSTEEHLQLLEELFGVVEDQVRSGRSTNALLRLEVEMERQRDRLDTHRSILAGKLAELQGYWSVQSESTVNVDDLESYRPKQKQVLDFESLKTRMMSDYPGLKQLRHVISKAGQQVDLAKLERRPDFTLSLNYIEVDDVGYRVPHAGDDPWSVGISVSLPIWEGKNRANIQSAQADKRGAEAMLREESFSLQSKLSSLIANRNNAASRVERYEEKLIPLAEQSLENTRSGYTSGTLGILDLIDSERALIDLQLNYWRALADLLQSEARIETLTATKIQ